MKLTAMMIVRNEADRYLFPCIGHLLEFCDEVRVLDDCSEDSWVFDHPQVVVKHSLHSAFFEHEGRARQELLEWTMEGNPTHILAIDADEFVSDGQALRAAMEAGSHTGVWKLTMTEIWKADSEYLSVRWDGDWKPRPVGIAFSVPDTITNRQNRRHWRIPDRALACGRVPLLTQMAGNRTAAEPVTEILHFGWACEADRNARYQRYVVHDGGRFHQNKHLDSIMWGDGQVQLRRIPWWPGLPKTQLLERVNRT
jgi:hypothetical protein